jgi:hypothetical protein
MPNADVVPVRVTTKKSVDVKVLGIGVVDVAQSSSGGDDVVVPDMTYVGSVSMSPLQLEPNNYSRL